MPDWWDSAEAHTHFVCAGCDPSHDRVRSLRASMRRPIGSAATIPGYMSLRARRALP